VDTINVVLSFAERLQKRGGNGKPFEVLLSRGKRFRVRESSGFIIDEA